MHAFLFIFLDFYLTLSLAVHIAMGNDQAVVSEPSSVIYLKTAVLECARSRIEESTVLPMSPELFLCVTERRSGINHWNCKLVSFGMGWDGIQA